jgi:Ca-activated chloride channel family protein
MIDPASIAFQWPLMLWLLAGVPLLVLGYLRLLARRRREATRYANLDAVWSAGGAPPAGWRRHLPALLLGVALCAIIVAIARPEAAIVVPARTEAVILALDASGSMRATDVAPDRLTAAKDAARAFVERRPPRTRVGIVTVAGNATLVQSPTDNRDDLLRAIDRVQPQRGTALGSGIYVALATLLPEAGISIEQLVHGRPDYSRWSYGPGGRGAEKKPVPPGSNRSAAIVLLSDGESNHGPDPLQAAKLAAEHGVRIYTVGIGSVEGFALAHGGWSMRVSLDEDTLRRIAEITLGEYFAAGTAPQLRRIYEQLSARMAVERASNVEITAFLVAAGALLLALSALLSMLWFGRVA